MAEPTTPRAWVAARHALARFDMEAGAVNDPQFWALLDAVGEHICAQLGPHSEAHCLAAWQQWARESR